MLIIRLLAGRISTTPLITLFAQGSLHTDDPRMKRQSEGRRLKTHPIDTLRRLRRPQLDGGNRDVIYRLLTSSFRSRPLWVASWGSESDQRSGAGTPREVINHGQNAKNNMNINKFKCIRLRPVCALQTVTRTITDLWYIS